VVEHRGDGGRGVQFPGRRGVPEVLGGVDAGELQAAELGGEGGPGRIPDDPGCQLGAEGRPQQCRLVRLDRARVGVEPVVVDAKGVGDPGQVGDCRANTTTMWMWSSA
jgi:hypothetical protein